MLTDVNKNSLKTKKKNFTTQRLEVIQPESHFKRLKLRVFQIKNLEIENFSNKSFFFLKQTSANSNIFWKTKFQ